MNKVFILIFSLLAGCVDRGENNFSQLQDIAVSPLFLDKATARVDENIPNGRFSDVESRSHYGGGMAPGEYWIENQFDWESVGFAQYSKIYVLTEKGNVSAVLFQEVSRTGIYIQPMNQVPLNATGFVSFSSRVGVFNLNE